MIHNMFAVPTAIDIREIFANTDFSLLAKITKEGELTFPYAHIERNKERYLQNHIDKYHYVLNKIIEGKVFNRDLDTLDYIPLQYKYLENMLGIRYAPEIMGVLRKLKIIQRDSYYITGLKSYAYRIHPNYISKIVLRDIYKTEIWDNKLAKQKAAYKLKVSKSHKMEWNNLTKFKIKKKEAIDYIQQKEINTNAILATFKSQLEEFSKADYNQFKLAYSVAISQTTNKDKVSFIYKGIFYSYNKIITKDFLTNKITSTHYNILYKNHSLTSSYTSSPFSSYPTSSFSLYSNSISSKSLYWSRLYSILYSIKVLSQSYNSSYLVMNLQSVKKALQKKENEALTAYQLLNISINNQYSTDEKSIQKIENEEWFIEQPDKLSRIYTNLSNLSTDLRKFLYHKKYADTLVNLDIRNSQPYIFSLLLSEKYKGLEMPDDVKEYIQLTSTGKFYEYVMRLLGMTEEEIKDKIKKREFKQEFFGKIFFCTPHYSKRTREGKAFGEAFPNVYSLINEHKEEAYEQLAIDMQRTEAKVVLRTIGSQLQKENIWFSTIHDSVVVLKQHAEHVKQLVLDSFLKAIGIAPTINPEDLMPS